MKAYGLLQVIEEVVPTGQPGSELDFIYCHSVCRIHKYVCLYDYEN